MGEAREKEGRNTKAPLVAGLSCAFATAVVKAATPTGLEPASSTLTTWRSTVELQSQHPPPNQTPLARGKKLSRGS